VVRFLTSLRKPDLFAKIFKETTENVSSNNTLHTDAELKVQLRANKVYAFYIQIYYQSVAAADFKYDFTVPTDAIGTRIDNSWTSKAENLVVDIGDETSLTTNFIQAVLSFNGFVDVKGTSGEFAFRWAQENSDAGITNVKRSSHFLLWEK